jgi:AcrR family transcriptional regulator
VPRRTAAEAAATRESILESARHVFAVGGYAAASLESIAERAGVTRGAVHHHFGDKGALFVEVLTELEHELDRSVRAAAAAAAPSEQMRAGCRALFDFFARPDYRQVALADGPAVVGLTAWYEIDRGIGMPTLRAGVQALGDAGLLSDEMVEPVTVLLFGALTEASLVLGARLTDIDQERFLDAIDLLVAGLVRISEPAS